MPTGASGSTPAAEATTSVQALTISRYLRVNHVQQCRPGAQPYEKIAEIQHPAIQHPAPSNRFQVVSIRHASGRFGRNCRAAGVTSSRMQGQLA